MGKKGYDPHEKQSSTMSNKQALELLLANDFAVATVSKIPDVKAAFRKEVYAARRQFGEDADISNTGRSVRLVGNHLETGELVREVHIKLSGMLGLGERDELLKKTGIAEFYQEPKYARVA